MKKNMKKNIIFLIFFMIIIKANAVIYNTNSANGDWMTSTKWTVAGPPASGLSVGNENIINILAGQTIEISGEDIYLSNVIIHVYGTLLMSNQGAFSLDYANLFITGAGSGVIIHTGGSIIEDVIIAGSLNIDVNGVNVWNGSNPIINSTSTIYLPTSLPVELLYFTSVIQDNVSILKWATASETNNDYFTIQESNDGLIFNDVFKIKSTGDFSQYEYKLDNKNKSYFRLMQTDLNGDYSLSEIIKVDLVSSMSIYSLNYKEYIISNCEISIIYLYDQIGKIIEIEHNNNIINLYDKSGMYFLHVYHSDGLLIKKIYLE